MAINSPLAITSPSNLAPGQSVSITPVFSLLSAPAGANAAEALTFISLNPSTLVFTGANQALTATIQCNVPAGKVAGSYAYEIATPGWPAGAVDNFAVVNMNVTTPQVREPPSVQLNSPVDLAVYTYVVGGSPVSIPLQFQATAPAATPIISVDANANGASLSISPVGLGTGSVTVSGNFALSAPGIYTVEARATNAVGTSATTVAITVNITGSPPTVAIGQPAGGSSFVYYAGSPPLAVPFAFTAHSVYGGVTVLSATLNGAPIAFTPSGIGTLNASGSGTLSLNAGGQYVLVVTATDVLGSGSGSTSFGVAVKTPPPTVTIGQPLNGAVFSRVAGSPPLSIPLSFSASASSGYTVNSISASLNGTAVTITPAGIGTALATGTGMMSVGTAGTYTLTATALSGGTSAASQATFTVTETAPPPPPCNVVWLPPISLGKVREGGSTIPIKFQIQCCGAGQPSSKHRGKDDGEDDDSCDGANDASVKIAIYEIMANGSISTPQIFSDGHSPNPPTYAIEDDGVYHLNFPTARGSHRYHIDIARYPTGSAQPQVIGTKEFVTR